MRPSDHADACLARFLEAARYRRLTEIDRLVAEILAPENGAAPGGAAVRADVAPDG